MSMFSGHHPQMLQYLLSLNWTLVSSNATALKHQNVEVLLTLYAEKIWLPTRAEYNTAEEARQAAHDLAEALRD